MPKVSIYLPEDLYRRAKDRKLPLSSIAQDAIEAALRREAKAAWVERMRRAPNGATRDYDISEIMAEVRDEFGR